MANVKRSVLSRVDVAIREARKNVGLTPENESSARLCLADAVSLYDAGDYDAAHARAIRSLRYSMGFLAPEVS